MVILYALRRKVYSIPYVDSLNIYFGICDYIYSIWSQDELKIDLKDRENCIVPLTSNAVTLLCLSPWTYMTSNRG